MSSFKSAAHNWLIFKLINPALEERFAKYARGRLLDIGCGEKPYKEALSSRITEHVGVDHAGSIHQIDHCDILSSAYSIPVPDCSFDCVLCTDVLEHLEEPADALVEAYRVLKPGGFGIYTVPLFWHLHEEPRDFFRYTKYGLRYLFERAGFEVIDITALSGYWAMIAQMTAYYVSSTRYKWYNPKRWTIWMFRYAIQRIAYHFNQSESSRQFTLEYIAVVRRPLDRESQIAEKEH